MKFSKAVIGLAMAVLLVAAGCGGTKDTPKPAQQPQPPGSATTPGTAKAPPKIVYGGSSWLGHYPAMVAIEREIWKKQGLNVEFKSFPTSSARMAAVAAGEVDFASTGAISAISLMAAGDRSWYLIGTQDVYSGQEGIVANEKIKTLADLKGKKLALPFSSSSHVIVYDLLKQVGLNPGKDVQLINMSGDNMLSAFTNGEIDAACIWVPTFTKLLEVKGAHVLGRDTDTQHYKKYGFTTGPDVLVLRKKFVEEYPEAAKKVVAGYFEAANWIAANQKDAVPLLVKYTKVTPEQQLDTLKPIRWLTIDDQPKAMQTPGKFVESLEVLTDFLYENKLIPAKPTVKEWVNVDVFK